MDRFPQKGRLLGTTRGVYIPGNALLASSARPLVPNDALLVPSQALLATSGFMPDVGGPPAPGAGSAVPGVLCCSPSRPRDHALKSRIVTRRRLTRKLGMRNEGEPSPQPPSGWRP